MENSKKNRIYDIVVLVCVYLIANGIPFSLIFKNEHISFACNSILLVGFLVFYFFYIKKYKFDKPALSKLHPTHLLFLPFLLIACSNFIYISIINGFDNRLNPSSISIIEGLINSILVACCEELVFRGIVTKEISRTNNKLKTILFSSLIFGGVHIFNISSIGSILPCLAQCCYSFFLGLLLSTMYLYSKNIILPIILHFSFNFLNDKLVTSLFDYEITFNYYLVSVLVGVVIFIYLVFVYLILRKDEIDYVS